MDEKVLLLRAKDYITQMANGINPLTGEIITDNDLINNIKISRCLFFVSGILDKYYSTIESNTISRKSRKKFYACKEDLINFNYSTEPIYISIITDKINDIVRKDDMRKLPAASITKWLVSKGFLTPYIREDGKNSKKPTALGEELGIIPIEKEGQYGHYTINTYNLNAQQYIIDHIEEISKSNQ